MPNKTVVDEVRVIIDRAVNEYLMLKGIDYVKKRTPKEIAEEIKVIIEKNENLIRSPAVKS